MSNDDVTLVSILIHVPFIMAWIGLVLFDIFASSTPGLADRERGRLIARTRAVTVLIIAVILITGIWQTAENPFVKVTSWSTLEKLRTRTYGEALFFKHIFVVITVALTLWTRFLLAPRLEAQAVTANGAVAEESRGLQRLIARVSLLNLAACFAALILAARMEI